MFPSSFGQQGLWFLCQLEGPSATYNAPTLVRLDGELDREALGLALNDLVGRHEVLRTVFRISKGIVNQHVMPCEEAAPQLTTVDTAEEDVGGELARLARVPFDLATDLPFRAHLLAVGARRHYLLIVMHHVVTDGASEQPLYRDLAEAYKARIRGTAPAWDPLPVQYVDYAAWQRELLGDPEDPDSEWARQLAFWSAELADLPDEVTLPPDRPRPTVASHRGADFTVRCPPEVHAGLMRIARDSATTPFMAVQAALAVLLTRMGAGDDIPLGSTVAGRPEEALEDMVGYFVNTVVLRTDTSGNPSFRELLRRVRDSDLAAWDREDLPFDQTVAALNPDRYPGRHPLFQVSFAMEDADATALELPGLTAHFEPIATGTSKFDLTFVFTRCWNPDGTPGELLITVDYAIDLYASATARTAAERLARLLTEVIADPDVPIMRVELLSPQEREQVLSAWHDPLLETASATLSDLFEAQARLRPDAVAVVAGTERITYADLNARANRLARHLVERGVGPESLVAVLLGRSAELAVALLAVLKAGGAYLPIDPEDPEERITQLFEEGRPVLAVTDSTASRYLPREGASCCVTLDDSRTLALLDALDRADLTDQDRRGPLLPAHPAYVIYTSGSTGRPKGVAVPHENVSTLLKAAENRFPFGADDIWAWFHSYAFDVSVFEMWGALAYGGTLVTVPFEVSRSPRDLLSLLAQERVTILGQTPSVFYPLILEDAKEERELALRAVMLAGEELDFGRLRDWYGRHPDDAVTLINMYGITETTVHASCVALDLDTVTASAARNVVGRPLPGLRVFVLDEALTLAPVGVVGELYVAGTQLARGYLQQPGLTAERFVASPFGPTGARMYRSGDLARWNSEGLLEYMGRADDQVKVRGFRIEPSEIQAVLTQSPDVARSTVVVREDVPGDKRLVAYAVPSDDTLTADVLRAFLQDRLPDYMVPEVILVSEILLTRNGKIDRRALPARTTSGRCVQRHPRTPVERELCTLFAEVLNVPQVGVDDNFFTLGGYSLLAVMLLDRVKDITGTGDAALTIRDLYRSPTVAGLAEQLATRTRGNPMETVLTMRPGSGAPLFCVHTSSGLGWIYSGLLRHIDEERPVIGLQSPQFSNRGDTPANFGVIADGHVARIREAQPHGPYHLLGWSFGGVLAHAIAVRLEAAGERVATLALLDAFPLPQSSRIQPVDRRWVMDALLGGSEGHPDPGSDRELVELLRSQDAVFGMLEPEQVARIVATTYDNVRAFAAYDTQGVLSADVLFFEALGEPQELPPHQAWAPYVQGRFETHGVDCGHMEMYRQAPLRVIGDLLDKRLSL
ncbi:amino acid adenylation domain-containing protein [Streptomyces niveus]|uniref:non-ribosomal peptide synthetase n=1 Tax=Streptomyces niveus TaxID=193462 RepID=UPI00367A34EE